MRKFIITLFFALPYLLYAQTTDDTTPPNSLVEAIQSLPRSYQLVFSTVLKDMTFKEGIMSYTLPNGVTLTSNLNDSIAAAEFFNKIAEANKVYEISNIPFGSSYEEAISVLESKYGDYDYLFSTKDRVLYKNKKYAGVDFSSLYFLFQSDGRKSYFNGAIFCIDCKSKSEAISTKSWLHEKLSKRYTAFMNLDNEEEYLSVGGIPPVPTESSLGFGVRIDILDYGDDGKVLGTPYGVRLVYGPYNYVNEEF